MSQSILTQSSCSIQPQSITVYEYSLTLIHLLNSDIQKLTAAFTKKPTPQDWKQWLAGWSDTGYQLTALPQLIRTI